MSYLITPIQQWLRYLLFETKFLLKQFFYMQRQGLFPLVRLNMIAFMKYLIDFIEINKVLSS